MRLLLSLLIVSFLPLTANAQCASCQALAQNQAYSVLQVQSAQPRLRSVLTFRADSRKISAQCIGAAIDAFIAWKAQNPDSGFFGGLAPAFDAYARCSGQSRLSLRAVLKIRSAVRAKNTQINAASRARATRPRFFRR